MDFGINGKNAVVTGAAQGIGYETAIALGKEGTNLVLNDLDLMKLQKVKKEVEKYNVKVVLVEGDISLEEDVKRIFKTAHKEVGKIEIMVNNAAYSPKTPFDQIGADEFRRVMNINLLGSYLCSKYAFEDMKTLHWGRIINLSSIAGRFGADNAGLHYSATKGGIVAMTLTQAKKMGSYNVTANCVAPGRIYTALTRELPQEKIEKISNDIPLKRIGNADEVANVICFLASQKASYISGACIDVRGGYIA